MSSNPNFQLNFGTGFVPVPPPANWPNIKFEPLFTSDTPSATLQNIGYIWEGNTAIQIYNYRTGGLTGATNGVLEGLPVRIFLGSVKIFDGILDLPAATWECDKITCTIRQSGQIEWIKSFSQSFDFALLFQLGIITSADFKKTPYCITTIPDYPQLTLLFLEEFVLGQQIAKEIDDLTNLIEMLVGDASVVATVLGAPDAPTLAATIVEIVGEVAYITIMFVAIVALVEQIFDQIVQTKKYKYCMLVRTLFEKACAYMSQNGYPITVESSIFTNPSSPYYNLTIMPKKIIIPKIGQSVLSKFDRPADENRNSLSYGYYEGNFRKLMDEVGKVFNAKPYPYGGKLTFEEVHTYLIDSGFIMPNEGEPGYTYNYQDPHKLNIGELSSSYELAWSTDSQDENTLQQYGGTTCEIIIQPNTVAISQNLLMPGLTRIDLPFAMAKRKEYLSNVEQVLDTLINNVFSTANMILGIINDVINAINSVISWFGGSNAVVPIIPIFPTVGAQVGFLELSNDTFSVQKMFIGTDNGEDWEIHPSNAALMSAVDIMQGFHGKNLMTRGNQWKLYAGKKFKICSADFFSILQHNLFTTADGKIGKFDKLVWNPTTQVAESVDFRIRENWTNNLNERLIVNGG